MTNRDMADAVGESHWPTSPDLYDRARRLINAALRHAIDSDAVVTKEDHEADLQRLGESLRDVAIQRDAARDMAIACSVRDQMADLIANSQNDVRAYCLERLDVDAIIAQIELDS